MAFLFLIKLYYIFMKRQNIILGDYTYIVDLYKADYSIISDEDKDILSEPIYRKFKFIRKSNILLNTIIYDTDIYFIDSNDSDIIYPISSKSAVGYSKNVYHFNPDLNEDNLNYNVYSIYNSSLEEIPILCDKVRIYLPTINPDKKCIIDIENYINDIKFHYIIKNLDNFETFTNSEININHNSYCEYIDIYIPNIENLINNENLYILEYNQVEGLDNIINNDTNLLYIPFNSLYKKFIVEDNKKIYKKNIYTSVKNAFDNKVDNVNIYTYEKENSSTEIESEKEEKEIYNTEYKNSLYNTLNVILYPYEGIDDNGFYIIRKNISYNSDIFTSEIKFNLKLDIKFPKPSDIEEDFEKVKGVPCLFCKFKYPKLKEEMSLEDSYLYFNNLTKEDYDNIDLEDISDENDEIEDNIKKTGYLIQISSDNKFNNIIYKYSILLGNDNEPIIDDLIFPLNNIFDSWDNFPDILNLRVVFIDKCSSNIILSNPVIITREIYKYIVGEKEINRVNFSKIYYNDKNNNTISTQMADYINGDDIKIDGFNFIDKINANVIDSDNSSISIQGSNKLVSSKVIYKPIFYKVAELQSIRIKENVKQNIGINLSDVMTKVESFKLIIDSIEYTEYARNDIYVLFNINASLINSNGGRYTILNQDDEFISDGSWYLY